MDNGGARIDCHLIDIESQLVKYFCFCKIRSQIRNIHQNNSITFMLKEFVSIQCTMKMMVLLFHYLLYSKREKRVVGRHHCFACVEELVLCV